MPEASEQVTRQSASNLAGAFILLPKEKRRGMSALYAFCRQVDDVADEDELPVEERRRQLEEWRRDLRSIYKGETPRFPVMRELAPVVDQYGLDQAHFDAILDGMEMDLETRRYDSLESLEKYCYNVASAVGLLSIEIFGYQNPDCKQYAVSLGKALQLTNILRDVAVDAKRDRIYLPLDLLSRFEVKEEEILKGRYSERYESAARSLAEKAGEFYGEARRRLPAEDRRQMIAAELMGAVYWRILKKLRQNRYNVFEHPKVRVPKPEKMLLALSTWWRIAVGGSKAAYGEI